MSSDEMSQHFLTTRVIYEDDDLIELKTDLRCGSWSGVATTYASAHELAQQANSLLKWTRQCEGDCVIKTGAEGSLGWLLLRFYAVDLAGHTACHISMGTSARNSNRDTEPPRKIYIEMKTELGLIERFAKQLAVLGAAHAGEASLEGVP